MPPLRSTITALFLAALSACHTALAQVEDTLRAKIVIDARKSENAISPLLYGQFIEFMYEGIKRGLHAELIRDRSFRDTASPNA